MSREELLQIANCEDIFNAFVEANQDMYKIYNETHKYPDKKPYIDKLVSMLPCEVKDPILQRYPFILSFESTGTRIHLYLKFTQWDKEKCMYGNAQLIGRILKPKVDKVSNNEP